MRGDFSRVTFDPRKHFASVRMQQGRVQLDRDWNEGVEITEYLERTEAIDVIGRSGAPKDGGGFALALTPDASDLLLSPGRMYVDGILAENDGGWLEIESFPSATSVAVRTLNADGRALGAGQWVEVDADGVTPIVTQIVTSDPEDETLTVEDDLSSVSAAANPRLRRLATYATQPDLPEPPPLTPIPAAGRTDLLYLDVWRRHVSSVEDPSIQEEALGGADTATRTQTVWQVRVQQGVSATTCADLENWSLPARDGRLTSDAVPAPGVEDPCEIPPGGGFQGIENRLYRIEIHEDSDSGAATFKWSRDNGSLAFAVEEFVGDQPTDRIRVRRLGRDRVLAVGVDDWVEVLDDDAELAGRPGTLARVTEVDEGQRILTLSKTVSGLDADGHPKVVRWDQGSDAVPVAAGPLALEDGVRVRFGGTEFATGDHWIFGARTLTGDVDRLEDSPPHGIDHHAAPLALVTWKTNEEGVSATIEDCRPSFPPLTDIWASDVFYDDAACELGADTVQEALDRLCTEVDLPFHKKHLHGWGIVCGLQVECCDDDTSRACRERVEVRTGYAVDCEGRDVVLREDVPLQLVDLVRRHDEEHPDAPILNGDGDGNISLILESRGDEQFSIERYDPTWKSMSSILDGTLLMDFYEDCIKTIVDFVRSQFTVPAGEQEKFLVGPTARRLTTFGNLLVQLVNPTNGRRVFLSAKEDAILREFYDELRRRLHSHTFCAMFDGARPFPDYPRGYPFEGVSTIFGKGFHTRLKVHPAGRVAYTAGGGNRIHVYDLEREEMVADVEFPGGAGAVVQDIAISPDGRELYAVGLVKGQDTVFGVAGIGDDGTKHSWRPVTVLCDCDFVALETSSAARGRVFAIGRGHGLYSIDPNNVPTEPTPLVPFNAVGHLAIDTPGGQAFATAAATGAGTSKYDRFVRVGLTGGTPTVFTLPGSGDDDLALVVDQERNIRKIYVVVDPTGGDFRKRLLVYGAGAAPTTSPGVITGIDDTDVRLGYSQASAHLLVGSEDGYVMQLVDVRNDDLAETVLHPLQISPIAFGSSPRGDRAYALNYASNTITTMPAERLVPGTDMQLDELGEYRDGVLEAFTDLFAGFLQYLKDCFCDHLLIKCPTCDEDDKLYLAAVSIRGGRVYQVCNFSRRKYLKTFPNMGYWMSIVPIIPLLDRAIASFCCSVLPRYFSRISAPAPTAGRANRVKSGQFRKGVGTAQTTDFRGLVFQWLGQMTFSRSLFSDAAGSGLSRVFAGPAQEGVAGKQVVGAPTEAATARLEENQVVVESVQEYDPARVANVVEFARAPANLPAGTRVTLFEREGKVAYYALAPAAAAAPTAAGRAAAPPPSAAVEAEMTTLRTELATLQTEVERLRGLEASLDRLSKLESRVERLGKESPEG